MKPFRCAVRILEYRPAMQRSGEVIWRGERTQNYQVAQALSLREVTKYGKDYTFCILPEIIEMIEEETDD